jgi:hypothetical protein
LIEASAHESKHERQRRIRWERLLVNKRSESRT